MLPVFQQNKQLTLKSFVNDVNGEPAAFNNEGTAI